MTIIFHHIITQIYDLGLALALAFYHAPHSTYHPKIISSASYRNRTFCIANFSFGFAQNICPSVHPFYSFTRYFLSAIHAYLFAALSPWHSTQYASSSIHSSAHSIPRTSRNVSYTVYNSACTLLTDIRPVLTDALFVFVLSIRSFICYSSAQSLLLATVS
ncbi:hypothetical protein VKT23_007473 [Stygiomarasmius scandens]|uniref:Uncharacterized protein n=1 Tax=Marasmiellus scandens TaxID=2682957 RepID=A0ABR1JL69_9AGAR